MKKAELLSAIDDSLLRLLNDAYANTDRKCKAGSIRESYGAMRALVNLAESLGLISGTERLTILELLYKSHIRHYALFGF